ncbi:MAG: MBL fold metallo-hydrolase [Spirochaetia bacterium]|nr:MBL fold metallo-hydrolase [Spirochaetia bacterium]
MLCTYLGHSAFLLETEEQYLLLDYTSGELSLSDEKKPLYVFASHRHSDHYTPKIFSLSQRKGATTFILSSDISIVEAPSLGFCRQIGPNEEASIDSLLIRTLRSTDEGVAFVIEVEGKVIYFAGDLNHWHWEGESDQYNEQMAADYHLQLEYLPQHLDLAFVPVDPRLGPFYSLGATDLVQRVKVSTLVPMHFWNDSTVCQRLKKELKDKVGQVLEVTQLHQTWRIV